jgi:dTDP-4-dehydrorhamnose reductase
MKVTVFDLFFFGNYLPKDNKNLFLIKGDIRDIKKIRQESKNHDIFLNLACISNDASFELDEKLSTSINLDAFEPMVIAAKENGIKKFIYASSSSVYGISEKKNVTEDHELVPLTLYNKYKGMCEPYLLNNTDNNFIGTTHLDASKITSNFILATSNILEQHISVSNLNNSNFTLATSNILETHSSNFTLATSNILETHSSNFTNKLRADVNKWINEETELTNVVNTYIYNKN